MCWCHTGTEAPPGDAGMTAEHDCGRTSRVCTCQGVIVPAAEERLPEGRGGTQVWRSDQGVHRPTGPWTATVHEFLNHLAGAGFDGAPRVLGIDDHEREVLTFIDGEVLADPTWQPGDPGPWPAYARSEQALIAAGSMLRRLHDASAGFRPSRPVWKQYAWSELVEGEIVCHGDIGRHNTVYRNGLPVAFIDWETIRPNLALVEFGAAAWKYVPLGTDAYFAASDFEQTPDLPRRLAMFADAYGVTDAQDVLWAIQHGKQRSVEAIRYWPVNAAEAAAATRTIAADLEWLATSTSALMAHLD